MKYNKIFIILFILTLINNSFTFKSKTKSKNKSKTHNKSYLKNKNTFTLKNHILSQSPASFKFSNKNNQKMNNKENDFIGKIAIDSKNKGIIISTFEEKQVQTQNQNFNLIQNNTDSISNLYNNNDKMLRLISEKIFDNTYLIDFRLFRSCDLKPKIIITKNKKNKKNENEEMEFLSITFSPKSLENRSKNEKYDITVNIKNFRNFISEENYKNFSTEKEIRSFLFEKCTQRKNDIISLKENFSEKIKNFTERKKYLIKLNSNLNSHLIEMNNIKTAISDTQRQLNDINLLRNSYKTQIKSINNLTRDTNFLISKETKKSLELRTKEMELNSNLAKKLDEIKLKEEEITKEKENFHKFIESSKDIENKIIKRQKVISEEENKLSSIQQNKMKLTYDSNNANIYLKKIKNKKINLIAQIKKIELIYKEKVLNMKKVNKEKKELKISINKEKIEIESLQEKINELILKKSTKEENLKTKYDILNTKEDEISKLKIDLEANITQKRNFEDKKNNIFEKEEKKMKENLQNLTNQILTFEENYTKTSNNLKEMKQKIQDIFENKEKIENLSEENKQFLDKKTREKQNLQLEKNEIEKKIFDSSNEMKDKENKLRNLKTESINYNNEISNFNKSLNSATDNLETFNIILNDYKLKLEPLDKKYKEFIESKNKIEIDIKKIKKDIINASDLLKLETPSATIMVDLAVDEAFNFSDGNNNYDNEINDSNSLNNFDDNSKLVDKKLSQLVDNIIA